MGYLWGVSLAVYDESYFSVAFSEDGAYIAAITNGPSTSC